MRSALLLLFLAACGGDDGGDVIPDGTPADASCAPTATMFIQGGGGTYTQGTDDATMNTSSVLSNSTATFSATALDATDWQTMVDCIAAAFAPFRVTVTDEDPGAAAHIEAVFVPNDEWTSTGLSSTFASISPSTCTPLRNPIILVNEGAFGTGAEDLQMLCELTVQSIAVSQGLDAENFCGDLMSWQTACSDRTFTDELHPCGEFEDRACRCGGTLQNSYQALADDFGEACDL